MIDVCMIFNITTTYNYRRHIFVMKKDGTSVVHINTYIHTPVKEALHGYKYEQMIGLSQYNSTTRDRT